MSYMLASNEECIAEEWNKYAGFTVRPLSSTCGYYKDLIRSNQDKESFLMYGGTPEIRSIFQELDLNVTVVDRSELIIRSMGLLTRSGTAIDVNERFILTDWLSLEGLTNKYDVMIGDDAINMVEWPKFELFLSNASRVLKSDGLFICHLLVKPDENLITKSIDDIDREYDEGIIKSKYDLASRLNFICYDNKSFAMGWQKTIEEIGINQLARFKPSFDFVDTFRLCNSKFYCPPQSEFESLVARYFKIEEIFYPHEHEYCMFEPVYVLRKK